MLNSLIKFVDWSVTVYQYDISKVIFIYFYQPLLKIFKKILIYGWVFGFLYDRSKVEAFKCNLLMWETPNLYMKCWKSLLIFQLKTMTDYENQSWINLSHRCLLSGFSNWFVQQFNMRIILFLNLADQFSYFLNLILFSCMIISTFV